MAERNGGGASSRCPRLRLLLAAWLLALASATTAAGHGDPASHYLETESLYPAFADRPSQTLELRLLGHLQAVAQRGYPIKVALVANQEDLVDNPDMLRKPQRYADFVGSELGQLQAPVVIVTAYGFGVSGRALRGGRLAALDRADGRALLSRVAVPRRAQGDALAEAAIAAVRELARAGGRPLPANVPPAKVLGANSGSSGDGLGINVWLIVGLFAIVFVPSVLLFEIWTRTSRRRRDHPAL
jgi:hypothetical protein